MRIKEFNSSEELRDYLDWMESSSNTRSAEPFKNTDSETEERLCPLSRNDATAQKK